jgi:RNA polymerase sigma-70 factor (ECF subfamily)
MSISTPSPRAAATVMPAERARALATARRIVGCSHLAEDVLQEAFAALLRLDPQPLLPGPWLIRAAELRARQLRRGMARRARHEHGAACAWHRGCDNPLHEVVAHELRDRLHAALATLPEGHRAALTAYVESGLDYAGVAASLQLPIGTVRSRLHRARLALAAVADAHA